MKVKRGGVPEEQDARLTRVTEYLLATLHEPPDYRQLARLAHAFTSRAFRGCG